MDTSARTLTEDPERLVGESLDAEAVRLSPSTPANEVAQLFQARDLVSTAVVDDEGLLLGRIGADGVAVFTAPGARVQSRFTIPPQRPGRGAARRSAPVQF